MHFLYADDPMRFNNEGCLRRKRRFVTKCEILFLLKLFRSFWYNPLFAFFCLHNIILWTFFQMDNPEGVFLPKDYWPLWLRWDHLAKPLPSLSKLLWAKNKRDKIQPSFNLGRPGWSYSYVYWMYYKQPVETHPLPKRRSLWSSYYESTRHYAPWSASGRARAQRQVGAHGCVSFRRHSYICVRVKLSHGKHAGRRSSIQRFESSPRAIHGGVDRLWWETWTKEAVLSSGEE